MSDNPQISNHHPNTAVSNLFRCSNTLDYFLLPIGVALAFVEGVGVSFFSILWGNLADTLSDPADPIGREKDVLVNLLSV